MTHCNLPGGVDRSAAVACQSHHHHAALRPPLPGGPEEHRTCHEPANSVSARGHAAAHYSPETPSTANPAAQRMTGNDVGVIPPRLPSTRTQQDRGVSPHPQLPSPLLVAAPAPATSMPCQELVNLPEHCGGGKANPGLASICTFASANPAESSPGPRPLELPARRGLQSWVTRQNLPPEIAVVRSIRYRDRHGDRGSTLRHSRRPPVVDGSGVLASRVYRYHCPAMETSCQTRGHSAPDWQNPQS